MECNCQSITQDNNECYDIYKDDETRKWILSVEGDYDFDYEEQGYVEINIEYCPFCGRRLL